MKREYNGVQYEIRTRVNQMTGKAVYDYDIPGLGSGRNLPRLAEAVKQAEAIIDRKKEQT